MGPSGIGLDRLRKWLIEAQKVEVVAEMATETSMEAGTDTGVVN